jgi:transcription elongation factor GreB
MSRGFVKEDDQEEIPMVPPRAHLPEGVVNYVTPEGMKQLLAEKQELIAERDSMESISENEKRIAINFINTKLQLLENRIAEARIVNANDQPKDEIRFSAYVTLKKTESEDIQTYQIVGVDEADISKGKISFISPLARILINKRTGEKVILKRAGQDSVFQIMGIAYK